MKGCIRIRAVPILLLTDHAETEYTRLLKQMTPIIRPIMRPTICEIRLVKLFVSETLTYYRLKPSLWYDFIRTSKFYPKITELPQESFTRNSFQSSFTQATTLCNILNPIIFTHYSPSNHFALSHHFCISSGWFISTANSYKKTKI